MKILLIVGAIVVLLGVLAALGWVIFQAGILHFFYKYFKNWDR